MEAKKLTRSLTITVTQNLETMSSSINYEMSGDAKFQPWELIGLLQCVNSEALESHWKWVEGTLNKESEVKPDAPTE